jgi:RNA polymerase sigma-70 factor (ECF subfamily)
MERDEVLLKLRERIVSFAASRLERDAAEDLAQDVLIVLHDKYAHVEAMEELVPLAMQIMRFKMVAFRRKLVRRGEMGSISVDDIPLPDRSHDLAADVERRELLDRIAGAMSRMGGRCRELFRLKLLGRTYAEIREELGAASINTVYTWDSRCRQELLARVGGSWEKRHE